VFEKLQAKQIAGSRSKRSLSVHPDVTGALKNGLQAIGSRVADGIPRFIWLPQMLGHDLALSPGNPKNAPY
jgi:hypothetical protein